MKNMDHQQIDPYEILQIPHYSGDDEIKQAYHKKISTFEDQELLTLAYSMIKNEKSRISHLWHSVFSYFEAPIETRDDWDFENLAKELAFLSDWEIEDEL